MSAILAWVASTKIGRRIVGLTVTLAALAAALFVAFLKGKEHQADTDKAKDAQANAQATQQITQAATTRQEVEHETDQLPDAPPQTVATADPGTAAGKLRTGGWLRDDASKN